MKTLFSASTLQDDLPRHAASTTPTLVAALHDPSAKSHGHVPLRRVHDPLVHVGRP